MFEVGKSYDFRMIEAGDEVTFGGTVAAYEHPLLKLEDTEPLTIQLIGYSVDGTQEHDPATDQVVPGTPGAIINVTSPNFVSAVESR